MAAEAISHPSAGELSPDVSPEDRREHHALLRGVVAELARERDDRDRDADPIDVAKRGAEEEKRDHRVALRPSRDFFARAAREHRFSHNASSLRQKKTQEECLSRLCVESRSTIYSLSRAAISRPRDERCAGCR